MSSFKINNTESEKGNQTDRITQTDQKVMEFNHDVMKGIHYQVGGGGGKELTQVAAETGKTNGFL